MPKGVYARPSWQERFWTHVDRRGDSECWLWKGNVNSQGYGNFEGGGKTLRAHRVSWELANKKQPSQGLFVCHTCDTPGCVNPAHLWIGSNSENQLDASAKGRHAESGKRFCDKGHEYTFENTYRAYGNRYCRACRRVAQQHCRQRRRAA